MGGGVLSPVSPRLRHSKRQSIRRGSRCQKPIDCSRRKARRTRPSTQPTQPTRRFGSRRVPRFRSPARPLATYARPRSGSVRVCTPYNQT